MCKEWGPPGLVMMATEYAQKWWSTVNLMGLILDETIIANTLVGDWQVGACNIDDWVNGARRDALFSFAVEQESPLVIKEEQVYKVKDGKERRVALTNRFSDGQFISKGKGIIGTMSRWTIGGIDTENGILIVRMTHTRGGQDGLIVLVRSGDPVEELRSIIAHQADEFGIGPEDFASLSWVPVH